MTDTWRPPEPDTIWRFTVDGAEHMLGRKLRDGERERIEKAFDASSIPDAVVEIMFQFADEPIACPNCGSDEIAIPAVVGPLHPLMGALGITHAYCSDCGEEFTVEDD